MIRHPLTTKFLKTGLFDGLRSFQELERRISAITVGAGDGNGDASRKARGDAFEVFVAAYLATQREQLVKQLWPRMQSIPPTVRRRLGLHLKDYGADGLIETADGEFRGYQAKFRTGRASLPWAEVSTFFGVTDRCDARLLVTNSTSVTEVAEKRSDFLSVRGNDLDQLTAADFRAILAWLKGAAPKRPKATPRPHQKTALAAIRKAFKQERRGTVVSACGTGKTLLALWAAEAHARRSVIVLLPSLALIRQTLRDWARNTNWKQFDYRCVCSDPTVDLDEDTLVVRQTEVPFRVNTDAKAVRKFLRQKFNGVKVIFTTYQSAPVVARGMTRGDAFDFGIFDEAHKTAGAEGKQNAFALFDANLRIQKRLFLTATPKKHRLPKKASERDKDLEPVYSMDQPSIYGPVIHKLTFGEAAKRGIICNYKVIISVVTSSVAEQSSRNRGVVMVKGNPVKASQVINQLAIAQAAKKHRIRKAFTFHRNIPTADSFVSDGKEGISTHLPDFRAFHVNGKMSTADREAVLKEFEEARFGLVSNVRCLTEGVDVPTVDMVAFMSPKRSKVDIVQAVGRAMRTSPETGKKIGYLLVPLHVELKKNESIEKAVARAGFDDVWQVLAAMQEQDEVLDEAIHRMQAERRLGKGFNEGLFKRRVEVVGPTIALAALRKAVATQCLDRLARPWDEYVQMLLAYRKKHGHVRVPADAGRPWKDLAAWVKYVRHRRRQGLLSPSRVDALNRVGFEWRFEGETLDSTNGLLNEDQVRRETGFSALAQYRKQGLIKPVGYAIATARLSAFYHPRQIKELKKRLGVTLDSTTGLLSQKQFIKTSRLANVGLYRKQGLLKPVGYAISRGAGAAPYYHPRQIKELKKRLGVTLDSTEGLLLESAIRRVGGMSRIARYRKKGLVKPIGYALAGSGLSAYYHPRQIKELKKKLGVTLDSTKGLLNEMQFIKATGLGITRYRERGLIKPVGYAITQGAGVSPYYHPRQIKELKKKLGVTLDSTKGLLTEKKIRRFAGMSHFARYRKKGLIRPVGYAITQGTGISPYYHPRQIKELKKKLGVTLDSTKGLLSETALRGLSGLARIRQCRLAGLIKPIGWALRGAGLSCYYHPRQIKELKKKLGVTLDSTKGLISEKRFAKASGLTAIGRYRQIGLVRPVGFSAAARPYYHPRQIKELKKKLGVTLDSTKGLLNERQFVKASTLTAIAKYRHKGLIKPVGYAVTHGAGVSPYYHPRQIKELKKKLGVTLDSTAGLLNERQLAKVSGIGQIGLYRKRGLIRPVGYAMAGPGVGAYYHPRQISEVRRVAAAKGK